MVVGWVMLRGTTDQQFCPMAVHGSAVRKTPCPIRMKRLCMQSLPLLEPETDPRRILFLDFLWAEAQPLGLARARNGSLEHSIPTPQVSQKSVESFLAQAKTAVPCTNPLLPTRNGCNVRLIAGHPCSCHSRKRLQKATLHVTVMLQGRLLTRSYPALPEPFTAVGKGRYLPFS